MKTQTSVTEQEFRGPLRTWLTGPRTPVAVLMIVLLGTGVFVFSMLRQPGVYWSDAHVRFVAPTNPSKPNSLQVSERSLTMTAGAVGQMVDDRDTPRASSPDVHISGLGIRSGYSVLLPNSGGQYVNYFADPYLDLQVVGRSPAEVRQTMSRLVTKTMAALTELQDRTHALPRDRIEAKVLPAGTAPVYYEHGSRKRSVAAALVIIIGIGAATAAALARYSRRPRKSNVALVG